MHSYCTTKSLVASVYLSWPAPEANLLNWGLQASPGSIVRVLLKARVFLSLFTPERFP